MARKELYAKYINRLMKWAVVANLPCYESAVEVDMLFGHGSLVEPEHVHINLCSEEHARFALPLVYVQ